MKVLRDAVHAEGFLFYGVIDLLLASKAPIASANQQLVKLRKKLIGSVPLWKSKAIPVWVGFGVLYGLVVELPQLGQLLRLHSRNLLRAGWLENGMLTPS